MRCSWIQTCFFLAAAPPVKASPAFAVAADRATLPLVGISVLNLAHLPKHLVNLAARHFRQTVFPRKLAVQGVPLALRPPERACDAVNAFPLPLDREVAGLVVPLGKELLFQVGNRLAGPM